MSKSYAQHRVLKGLDLDIADGEFISFLGPSGCGKSTMLYCIAGLEEITTGSILFDGRDISGLAPRDRSMVTVSALVAAGQTAQITYHLNRAMDNGLTEQEAGEMLTQLAFYAGWPNVFSAMPVFKDVFAKRPSGKNQ